MKTALILLISSIPFYSIPAQNVIVKKYIFVPHARSEDQTHQSVLPAIEQINFSIYDMIMLGGDLTYTTSSRPATLEYCDSLFNINSPNTLWTMGNHDVDNPGLIEEYTGRPSFYSYCRDNITFLVLNTELNADGFVSSHILGDQLTMIQNVCDTIVNSDYLVLLHHRLLWMIGDEYFNQKIDSVGESTRQLDTSNFNSLVFPLLKIAKSHGVKVLCLGGDKSKINIEYSPEDSITYIASTMAPEFTDADNDVVILTFDTKSGQLNWAFLPLDKVEKNTPVITSIESSSIEKNRLDILYRPSLSALEIYFDSGSSTKKKLEVYSLKGQLVYQEQIVSNEHKTVYIKEKGIYLVRLTSSEKSDSYKIAVY